MQPASTITIRLAFLGALQGHRGGRWRDIVTQHTQHVFASRSRRAAIQRLRALLSSCAPAGPLDLRMVGYSWGAWTAMQLADTILNKPGRIHASLASRDVRVSLGMLDPVATLRVPASLPNHPAIRVWNVYQRNGCYQRCPGRSGWFRGRSIAGALENRDVTLDGRCQPMRDDVPPARAPDHIQLGYRGWGDHDLYIASILEHGWSGPQPLRD
jgi:hypothetical protein